MNIAVLGTGYVGLVSGACFAETGNRVICCDIDQDKIARLNSGQIPIYEPGLTEMVSRNVSKGRLSFTTDIPLAIRSSEIIYIAVGTPMALSGEADLKYVQAAARTIGQHMNHRKIIVIKSTVPVGTGRKVQNWISEHLISPSVPFDVVSNPEFLREGTAIADCMNMERAVIGSTSDQAGEMIEKLHEPFRTTVIRTDVESAEMIKYASNTFLATKISFINAIANICERVGADVTKVAEGMGLDSRIGGKFLKAGIGYGGSCFPKDTHALVHIAKQSGYDFALLRSVIETNERQRQLLVEKLEVVLGGLKGKTIAVLGLSFKPNTDDVREAPSLAVIPALLERGASVQAYDPVAVPEASKLLPKSDIRYAGDLYGALAGADACVILTEWQEIVEMDLDSARRLLKLPIILDGRNCFTLDVMGQAGFIYHSIGRSSVGQAVLTTQGQAI